MSRWLPTLLLLLAVVVGGCATLPAPRRAVPLDEESGRRLLETWLARTPRHQTLQGLARVRVQTPQRTLNGTQLLLVAAPDRLRAETLSPFGTPLLVLAANGEALAVALPGEGSFYRGSASSENLSRFTRLPLELRDLVSILLADPPLIQPRRTVAYALDGGNRRLELEAGTRRQLLDFDDAGQLVAISYRQGEVEQLQLVYADYPSAGGLPRRIDLAIPPQQLRASLIFTELSERPPAEGQFTLAPSPGALLIPLDDQPASSGEQP